MSRKGLAVAVLAITLGACSGSATSDSRVGQGSDGGDAAADTGLTIFGGSDGAACVPKICNELPQSGADAAISDAPADVDGGPVICTPMTCAEQGFTCGPNSDGCGHVIQCGSCTGGDYCGGGGYSKCGNPSRVGTCVPKTCADFPATCGQQGDGCGGVVPTCGIPGLGPDLCRTGDAGGGDGGACTPMTCADYPAGTCGQQSDGCNGLTPSCGTCPAPEFCGGGVTPSTCGGNTGFGADGGPIMPCVPTTCTALGNPCGDQGDGCGGLLVCGTCTAGQTCGGGRVPSVCSCCTPMTCGDYPPGTCGLQSDGCGGLTAYCNPCVPPAYCGGGGPSVCGGMLPRDGGPPVCVPLSCSDYPPCGQRCAEQSDGCGGAIVCGVYGNGHLYARIAVCGGGSSASDASASDAPPGG